MVRNTTSAGTVAGTGIIRKPPGERGETDSGNERKRPSCCISAWFSTPLNTSMPPSWSPSTCSQPAHAARH